MTELKSVTETGQPPTTAELAGKYLTFRLSDEEYGVDIMKVQEIIQMMPTTKVPSVPDYVRGVINLRGKIIPTIELRAKFGLERMEDTERTCIIVVELQTERGKVNIGTIVDEVAEVMDFEENAIDNASGFGTFLDSAFILGVGIVKGGVKILLDIDKVLTSKEVKTMATLAQN